MFTLKTTNRSASESLDKLRKEGKIPAVYYGFNKHATSVTVSMKDFQKTFKDAGESTSIVLDTEDGKMDALIHEVQLDPVKNVPLHADFLIIDANKSVTVMVPIEFDGESPAVKTGLGSLVKVMHEVEVSALPKNLPHSLTVDISKLNTLEDNVFVSDITAPTGVTINTPGEEVVAAIVAHKEEVEETVPVDLSTIEVEKKGKKEDESTNEEAQS